MLLDHEFFMKQPVFRFTLRAPCNSGGHDRKTTRRSERRSNLPVGSRVLEMGAWQSRSLPYIEHGASYKEAGVEIEVRASSLSRVRFDARSVKIRATLLQGLAQHPGFIFGIPIRGSR